MPTWAPQASCFTIASEQHPVRGGVGWQFHSPLESWHGSGGQGRATPQASGRQGWWALYLAQCGDWKSAPKGNLFASLGPLSHHTNEQELCPGQWSLWGSHPLGGGCWGLTSGATWISGWGPPQRPSSHWECHRVRPRHSWLCPHVEETEASYGRNQ